MDLKIHAEKLVEEFLKTPEIPFSVEQNKWLSSELTDFLETHLKIAYKVGKANAKHFIGNWE